MWSLHGMLANKSTTIKAKRVGYGRTGDRGKSHLDRSSFHISPSVKKKKKKKTIYSSRDVLTKMDKSQFFFRIYFLLRKGKKIIRKFVKVMSGLN